MAVGGAGATREEWRKRAVTHLSVPDSFPAGEELFVPQPFEKGAVIETRSFQTGFRGAWFLSEVVAFHTDRSMPTQQVTIRNLSYPDDKPSKMCLYQVDPNDRGSRYLMVRPIPPRNIPFGEDAPNPGQTDQPVFKHERQYAKGDKVDAYVLECWWSGTVRAISGKRARVEWRPEPNLRPTLRWAGKRWHMLKNLTGPLGKIVVPVGGSGSPAIEAPGAVGGSESKTTGTPRKRGGSAGGSNKETEEAPNGLVGGLGSAAKETPRKRPGSAGGTKAEAKATPRKRAGSAGGSKPEAKGTPGKRPCGPATEAGPERVAKAGKPAADASAARTKPTPKPGMSEKGAETLTERSPPRVRPPPKVRTPPEVKKPPEKQESPKVRILHEVQDSSKPRLQPETLSLPKVHIPEKVQTPEEARTPPKVQNSPRPRHLYKVGERPPEDAGPPEGGQTEERPRGVPGRKCFDCGTEKTTAWRRGPLGDNTLCQTCGVRYWLMKLREKRLGRSETFERERIEAVQNPGPEGATGGSGLGMTGGGAPEVTADGGPEKSCMQCGKWRRTKLSQWRTGPPGKETLCNECGLQFRRLGPDWVPGGALLLAESTAPVQAGAGRYLAKRGEPTKGLRSTSAGPIGQKGGTKTGVEEGWWRKPGLGSGSFFDKKIDRSALEGKGTEKLTSSANGDPFRLQRPPASFAGPPGKPRQGPPAEKKRAARDLESSSLSESSKRMRIQGNSVRSASARIIGQALRNVRIRPDASGASEKAVSGNAASEKAVSVNAASESKERNVERERTAAGDEGAQAKGIWTQPDASAAAECDVSESMAPEKNVETESEGAEQKEAKAERERKQRAEARRKKRERVWRLKAQLACSIGEPKGQKVARLKAQLACSVGEPIGKRKRLTRQEARREDGEVGVKSGAAKGGPTSGKRIDVEKGGLTRNRGASDTGGVDRGLSSAAKKLAVYEKLKRVVGGSDKVTRPKGRPKRGRPKKGAAQESPRRNPKRGRKSDEEESSEESDPLRGGINEGKESAGVREKEKQGVSKPPKQKGPGRPVFWGVNLDELIVEEEFELPEKVRARAERERREVRRRLSEVSGAGGEAGSSGRDPSGIEEVLIHSVKVPGKTSRGESVVESKKAGARSDAAGLETGRARCFAGVLTEIGAGETPLLGQEGADDSGGSRASETIPLGSAHKVASSGGGAGTSGRTPPEIEQPPRPDEFDLTEELVSCLDKSEALSAAEELLSRWEEVSLDEVRGLFLMVNLWSPDEESLKDPVGWYRDKIEALAFREQRFVEVGSGGNAGVFRKWAVKDDDRDATTEGERRLGFSERLEAAKDGPLGTAPLEAGVNYADVSTAAPQARSREPLGTFPVSGTFDAEAANVPAPTSASLANPTSKTAEISSVPGSRGEAVRRDLLSSDVLPGPGASVARTLSEGMADDRGGGLESSDGVNPKKGLNKDDEREPIGGPVPDNGLRGNDTISSKELSPNGRLDLTGGLHLGQGLAAGGTLDSEWGVVLDKAMGVEKELNANGGLGSHGGLRSDGDPNKDEVLRSAKGPVSDGALKGPSSDAGLDLNGGPRADERDQGLETDVVRTLDGGLDMDEGLDSDAGLRADAGPNLGGEPNKEEASNADRRLFSHVKVAVSVGLHSDRGLPADDGLTQKDVRKSVEALHLGERKDPNDGHTANKAAQRSNGREGMMRVEKKRLVEDSERSGGMGLEGSGGGVTGNALETQQGLRIPPPRGNPPAAAAPVWSEHRTPDGRPYYFNRAVQVCIWEKPLELMTPQELHSLNVWKELITPDGRVYYSNRLTMASSWTVPEDLRAAGGGWAAGSKGGAAFAGPIASRAFPDAQRADWDSLFPCIANGFPTVPATERATPDVLRTPLDAQRTVLSGRRTFSDTRQAELDSLFPCSANGFRTVLTTQPAISGGLGSAPDALWTLSEAQRTDLSGRRTLSDTMQRLSDAVAGRSSAERPLADGAIRSNQVLAGDGFTGSPDPLRTLSDAQQTDLSGRRTLSDTMRRLSDAIAGCSATEPPLQNGAIGPKRTSAGARGLGGGEEDETHWLADLIVESHEHKCGAEQVGPPLQGPNPAPQLFPNTPGLVSPPTQKASAKVTPVQPLTSPIPPPTPSYPLAPSSISAWLAKPSENPQDGGKRQIVCGAGEMLDARTSAAKSGEKQSPSVNTRRPAPGVHLQMAPGGVQRLVPGGAGTVTEVPLGGAWTNGTEGNGFEAGGRSEQVPGGTLPGRENGAHTGVETAGQLGELAGGPLGECGERNGSRKGLTNDRSAEGTQPGNPATSHFVPGRDGHPGLWHTILPGGVLISQFGTPPDVNQGSMLPPATSPALTLQNAPVSNRGGNAAGSETTRVAPPPIWFRRRVSDNLTVFSQPPASVQGGMSPRPATISMNPLSAPPYAAGGSSNLCASQAMAAELTHGLSQGVAPNPGPGQMQPPTTVWGVPRLPINPRGLGAIPISAHPRASGAAIIALPAPGKPTEGIPSQRAAGKRGRPLGSKNKSKCRQVAMLSWEELQQMKAGGKESVFLALAAYEKPAPLEAPDSAALSSLPEIPLDMVAPEDSARQLGPANTPKNTPEIVPSKSPDFASEREGEPGPESTPDIPPSKSPVFELGREGEPGEGNSPELMPRESPVTETGREEGEASADEVGHPNRAQCAPNRAETGSHLAANPDESPAEKSPNDLDECEGAERVLDKFGRLNGAESGPNRAETGPHPAASPYESPAGKSPNGLDWFYSLLGPSDQSPRPQAAVGGSPAVAARPEERPETERPTARECSACRVSESPQWRRGPTGPQSLCNRCGVFWYKHRDGWGDFLEQFSPPSDGANGLPCGNEESARLDVPVAFEECPEAVEIAHQAEAAAAGSLEGSESPDGPVSAGVRTVGRATFREVTSEDEVAAALEKSLRAAATWQRMAHSLARTTGLRSRLEELGKGGANGGIPGGVDGAGNGSVLEASIEDGGSNYARATRSRRSRESMEKALSGAAEGLGSGGGAAAHEDTVERDAGGQLAGGAECLENGGGAAKQTGEGTAGVQLAGAGRRYGPEEIWCGSYRGRWGPDGAFVWTDSKSRRVRFRSGGLAQLESGTPVKPKGKKRGRKPGAPESASGGLAHAESGTPVTPTGKKRGPKPRVAGPSDSDADFQARRERERKLWEKRMDGCFDRIHEIFSRAKPILAALSERFPPGEGDRPVSASPPGDPKVSPGFDTFALRGLTDWADEEWELTPLPNGDPSHIGMERTGRHKLQETGGKEASITGAGDRRLSRSGRGERRMKHLKVKLSRQVFVDRTLTYVKAVPLAG
ncbi:hypothetical protein KFL_001780130 [Klebsormidium nitens]|uniref:Uncharacterized protein n=1 Tax=Klebsormidium nitens TaxID=105231 RepID=A0A1Y1I7R9_KLENI|nr:hypothetical protein KFL_001780130 [Klebsormidium nitens]|eukprot:GAQ84158.1 hypothetical protein KFL_001780130 [Klebsormidium nitens]